MGVTLYVMLSGRAPWPQRVPQLELIALIRGEDAIRFDAPAWALASEACAPVTLGTMQVGHAQARGAAPNRSQALLPLSPFAVHDSPVWRGEPRGHGECLVVNRTDAPRIHWADGSPIDARRCCTLELLLASIWYGHLTAEERLAL